MDKKVSQNPSSQVQPYYWKDKKQVVIPERWIQNDYGPRKLGPQRLAARKDGPERRDRGENWGERRLLYPES